MIPTVLDFAPRHNVYINDLPGRLASLSLVYADDVTLVSETPSNRHRDDCLRSVNYDLESAVKWSEDNQMQFSSAKSQPMLISRKKNKDLNGPTVMHGSELTSEQTLNLLGVSFSSSGTITEHVLAKAKTAGKLVSMLRRNRIVCSCPSGPGFRCASPVSGPYSNMQAPCS